MQRRGILVLVGIALAACVAPALAAAPATKIVHFKVFTPAGGLVGVHVTGTRSGSCFAGSIGLPRPDAWRCFVGNEILDPCLESPKGASVPLVCITTGHDALRLKLTKPLPMKLGNGPEKTFFPWRLILAGGDLCERFTGTAAGAIQGQGLVYGCTSGGTTTEPNRGHAAWTVRYLAKGKDPFKIKKLSELALKPVASAVG